jgi:hypothetical protein
VVLSVTPSSNAALNIAMVERIGASALHRFYEHIRLEVGEAFVFLDDKLIMRLGAFFGYGTPLRPMMPSPCCHLLPGASSLALFDMSLTDTMLTLSSKVMPHGATLLEREEEEDHLPSSLATDAAGGQTLPPSANVWEVLGAGVSPEISDLRALVVTSRSLAADGVSSR